MNATLELDAESMRAEELSMGTLIRELTIKKRPAWLLTRMMSALETERQKRGLGWSRPWNKIGLNVFRTHKVMPAQDAAYLGDVAAFLMSFMPGLPAASGAFARELMADPGLMAFVFYHNHHDASGEHEGMTISLGRKCASDPGKRDRLDIILEDRREHGAVDGAVDRLRIYACPWSEYGISRTPQLYTETAGASLNTDLRQSFYRRQVEAYRFWREEPQRQWSHWSTDYIDYFGPRSFIPLRSSFT